ncbi:MAG: LacI family DNA-binding transcriptional regulator [Candidatus Limnocylindria bacterium]
MAVTLSDVARQAGVSQATASRVLNGRRHVAVTTRLLVEAAARDLDYIPNRAARDLSTSRTATAALLVHHAQYPAHGEGTFSSRVVDGVSHALRRAGYDLLYVPVDDSAVARVAGLAAVRSGRSDGVLVLGPAFPTAALTALQSSGRPMVTIDARLPGCDSVMAANRAAMVDLTRHLVIDHEYRRLACLAGPSRWPSTAERIAGIRAEARRIGAEVRVIHARQTTMRDGVECAARLIDESPDAILAVNDAMAIGAMHRLRSMDADRRPAITGFDDIAWAQLTDPPLTTVSVDAEIMGAEAARLLIDRIGSPDHHSLPAREVRVPATLRLRRRAAAATASVHPDGPIIRGGEAHHGELRTTASVAAHDRPRQHRAGGFRVHGR